MDPRAYESAPKSAGAPTGLYVSPLLTTLGRVAEWQTLGT
jgi:hypothetical protein